MTTPCRQRRLQFDGWRYTLDGDQLTTGQMFTTEMACAEPLMKQDQWLTDFLSDVMVTPSATR